ncbi:aldo/keto reductase [Saccharicrinis aurantiacus]|uniref:aldo/keto reductase n=1 Tax=Saccharicrinis aurantiacus TaxID=1849719 RepID=UPI0024907125|nr:aldo/keto reductase [Saccharicrinis aurantiacus]
MNKQKDSRRKFIQKSVASSLGLISAPSLISACDQNTKIISENKDIEPIWRNRKEGMQYRMLGRTGMMVSELGMGTFPYQTEDCYPVLDASIERGINYFDCAFAYGQGKVEENIGKYFKLRGNREKVFLTTKLSGYGKGKYMKKIFDNLSTSEQENLRAEADALLANRMVLRPGYHFNYFNGQENQLKKSYLWHVVLQKYGMKKEWKQEIKKHTYKLLEDSLKRMQVDYVDVLFCPHGSSEPDLKDDILQELFSEFKQKGLIRASALSFHNDVNGNLEAATDLAYYDVAMLAYNIANHAAVDAAMYRAKQSGMGLIAMKVSRLYVMDNKPDWIVDKLNSIIPDENLSKFAKSYLWALQNPNLTSCLSQMETIEKIDDNLKAIGQQQV